MKMKSLRDIRKRSTKKQPTRMCISQLAGIRPLLSDRNKRRLEKKEEKKKHGHNLDKIG